MRGPTNISNRMFLITEGGPTYRIEQRVGLIREKAPVMVRRAFFAVLLTWVPLLILSVVSGFATGHRVPVPFLRDFAVHSRFLLAVPLMLVAKKFWDRVWRTPPSTL